MSIAPLAGVYASAAGLPLAQITGSDVERTRQKIVNRERQAATDEQADRAAGIAEPDGEDLEANDRDADGRRPWEIPLGQKRTTIAQQPSAAIAAGYGQDTEDSHSLDLTG